MVSGADTSNVPNQVLDPNGYDPIVAELVGEIMPRFGSYSIVYTQKENDY